MLVGKRPGPPIMRRTRSMSGGMAVDMQEATTEAISNNLEAHHEEAMPLPNSLHSHQHHEEDGIKDDPHADVVMGTQAEQTKYVFGTKGYELYDERLVGTDTVMFPSPTTTTAITDNHHSQNQTNNVNQAQAHAHLIPTPHFLRTCGLCRCHLATGRDIYMYRGDTAFCSLECREKQMKQDQKKEKWKVASNSSKQDHRVSPPTATAHASTKAQTAAAST